MKSIVKPIYWESYTESLNQDQKVFFLGVIEMVQQRKTGIVLLHAPAGTGKTYTINRLYDALVDYTTHLRKEYIRINVLAPTHKAKSLFRPDMKPKTIHSFIGAVPKFMENGEQVFLSYEKCLCCSEPVEKQDMFEHVLSCSVKKRTPYEKDGQISPSSYGVIIIDETSMLNVDMLNFFKKKAETNLVLCTGDCHQIPPVDIEHSPIFHYSHIVCRFTLSEQMRSKTDMVRVFSEKFREAVYNGVSHVHIKGRTSFNEIVEAFRRKEDCVVLNWRNVQTIRYNQLIRKALFTTEYQTLEDYYVGENLLFSGYKDVYGEYILHEQLEYRVNPKIEKPTSCPLRDISFPEDALRYMEHLLPFLNRRPEFGCFIPDDLVYHTNDLMRLDSVSSMSVDMPYYTCIHGESKCVKCNIKLSTKRIKKVRLDFHRLVNNQGHVFFRIKTHSKKKFDDLMDYYKKYVLSVDSRRRTIYWASYYYFMNTMNSPLNYAYSLTTHKSQGSQWNKVFVNIDDIRRNWSSVGRRLAYTAVSRAKDHVYFVGEADTCFNTN